MFEGNGAQTGVDLSKLVEVSLFAARRIGSEPISPLAKMGRA
jgi:hypothetical protein